MELIIYSVQVIHILVSILLIVVVLLQPGKGGDLGSVFGGGGGTSESVFGAAGAVPFLSKVTRVLAVLFLLSSLTLGYFAAKNVTSSVVTDIPTTQGTSDITFPDEATQSDTSSQESAPAEGTTDGADSADATQQGGETAPQAGDSQLSPEPGASGGEEPASDSTQ